MQKLYLDAQSLLEDSWRLGAMVAEAGFKPSFIVAVWRGGVPIGVAVQEYLRMCDIDADHIAIRTSSYEDIDDGREEVNVYSLDYLVNHVSATDRLLVVDDVFDTGRSIAAILATLAKRARRNMPGEVRVAVPYYKPARNLTDRVPDFYLHETDQWLKFPHSLEGLTEAEIRENRPSLADILAEAARE